jgi:hypothetical protein
MLPGDQCPRCGEEFDSPAPLVEHLRAATPCPLKNLSTREGITRTQEEKLRCRKNKKKSKLTEEDKWRHIYEILFPDDNPELMPSPCKLEVLKYDMTDP